MREIDHINVYLANSSLAVRKHDGVVISILECVYKDGETIAGEAKEVPYKNMSYQQSEAFSLMVAMERMKKPAKLEVYMSSKWLKNEMRAHLSTWKACGWIKSDGKPVMEELRKIAEYAENTPFEIHAGERHEFSEWLDSRCRSLIANTITEGTYPQQEKRKRS